MKPIILFALTLFTFFSSLNAQELKYELSEPVDISIAGTDKLLLMKNGNTVLFHFELRKGIIVKIFDKTHKEIASKKHICNVIDINTLDLAELKAVETIGNEAVLFITQQVDNRETLVRIRVNGNNGELVNEEKIVQSESFKNRTETFVLKQKDIDTYYVVCNKIRPGYVEIETSINTYDANHKLISTTPLVLDQKGYDYVEMHNAQIDDEGGIAIGVEFGKIVQYPDVNKRYMAICYLFKNTKDFFISKAELPSNYSSVFADLTFNRFEKNHNVLLSVNEYKKVEFGASIQDLVYQYHYIMIMNDDLSSLKYLGLNNSRLQLLIGAALDTQQLFNGNSIFTSTSNNGISTVIYNGIIQHREVFGLSNNSKYKHAMGVTQYNAEGNETWSAVLPLSKLVNYERYPSVFLGLPQRTKENNFRQFGSIYKTIGNNQMSPGWLQRLKYMGLADEEEKAASVGSEPDICNTHIIATNKNHYVFFNEVNRNISGTLSTVSDSVYNCERSIACYSIINKKKAIVKTKLFDTKENEFKQIIAGSGIYDVDKNIYTTLIRHRKGKEVTSKIAWIQLEP